MDNETVVRLIEAIIISAAGIMVAYNNRKAPKTEEKKAQTEEERVQNENYSSQFSTSKTLLDSTKALIEISSQLIKSVETQKEELQKKYNETESKYEELLLESRELKESTEALRRENHRVLAISNQLIQGIKILLTQLRAMNMEPLWQPPQELLDTIDRRLRKKDPSGG